MIINKKFILLLNANKLYFEATLIATLSKTNYYNIETYETIGRNAAKSK